MIGEWATAGICGLQLLAIVYYAGRFAARVDALANTLEELGRRVSRLENVVMGQR